MPNPTVSVILPCYNAHRYLTRALDSVRAQTFRDFEIIVVDDGSTDPETVAYLNQLPSNIRLVRQENRGLPGARNTGFREARGKYVLPLDCDDWIDPTFLEKGVAILDGRRDVAYAFSYIALEGEKTGILEKEFNAFEQLFLNQIPYCLLIRKEVWQGLGGYDETMRSGYEDWEFNIRVAGQGYHGLVIREPLFHYWVTASGMLQSVSRKWHAQLWQAIQARNVERYRLSSLLRIWWEWGQQPSTHSPFILLFLLLIFRLLPLAAFNSLFANFWWLSTSEQHLSAKRGARRTPSQGLVDGVWIVLFGSIFVGGIVPIGTGDGINVALYDISTPVLFAYLFRKGYVQRPSPRSLAAVTILILAVVAHSAATFATGRAPNLFALVKSTAKLTEFIVYTGLLVLVFRNHKFLRPSKSIALGIIGAAAMIAAGVRWLAIYQIHITIETLPASMLASAFVALVLRNRAAAPKRMDWETVLVGLGVSIVCIYGGSKVFALIILSSSAVLLLVPAATRLRVPIGVMLVGTIAVLGGSIYAVDELIRAMGPFWVTGAPIRLSLGVRLDLWEHAWSLAMASFPWGIGLGQYVGGGFFHDSDLSAIRYVHNTPLGMFTEMGLVGIGIFTYAIFRFAQALTAWPWVQRIVLTTTLGAAMMVHDVQGMRAFQLLAGMAIGLSGASDIRAAFRGPALALGAALISRLGLSLILIATARILPPEEFGLLTIAMTLGAVVNAVVSGGGDMWLNRFGRPRVDASGKAPWSWKIYLAITLGLAAGVVVLGSIGVIMFAPAPMAAVIFLAVVGVAVAGLAESILAIQRAAGRITFFFWLRDIAGPSVFLFLVLMLKPSRATEVLWLYLLVWASILAVSVANLVSSRAHILPSVRWNWRALVPALRHTSGLIYGNLGSRLSTYMDVLVLSAFVTLTEIGNYRVAAQIAIGIIVVQHFVFLGLPWQMRSARSRGPSIGLTEIRDRQSFLLGTGFVALVGLWLADQFLLSLFGPRFVEMAPVLQLLVLVRYAGLTWGPQHEILVSRGAVMADAHSNVATIVAWIVCFLLIRSIGTPIAAAVAATAISSMVGQFVRYVAIRRIAADPVFGHPFGPALGAGLSLAAAAAALYRL